MRIPLVLGAVALGLLTILICVLALWRSWDAAMEHADAEARNLAILIDRNISTMLDKASVLLGATSAQIERQLAHGGVERRGLRTLVDSGTALVPEIAQIGVFDGQGQQVCGDPLVRCPQLNVADRDYFRQLRAAPDQPTQLFGPYRSRVDDRPNLVLARALRSAEGAFAGVVTAVIPLHRFEELLGPVDLGESGVVHLRSADLGLLLRHPPAAPAALVKGGGAASDEFRQAVAAAPMEGSFRGPSPSDGIERQTGYRRLSNFPLYVAVGLGTREFLASWRGQMYWTLGMLVLFAAALAVIARLLLEAAQDQQRIVDLYDHAPCGYHSLDAGGTYRRINATELRWLGCTRDEVIGKRSPKDFFTEESQALFRRSFPTYLQTGMLEGLEFDLRSRDGTLRRVVISATAVRDAQGQVVLSNSVVHDITELHAARQELTRFVGELEARVGQRTRELRLLAAELDAAESRERQQLARDLHDDLGQTLAAAHMHLAAMTSHADRETRDTAVKVGELIDLANRSMRSLAAQLSPPMLDDLGLPEALEWLGAEIGRTFGLKVAVVDDGQPKPLSRETRTILYRATRELLINAAKHAGAETAEVGIERRGDEIVVRVADRGVGFDATRLTVARGHGMGLLSVRERMAFIGGRVDIVSIPGDGAAITLAAPLSPESEGPEACAPKVDGARAVALRSGAGAVRGRCASCPRRRRARR